MSKPLYPRTPESRLAGLERRVDTLFKRQQLPGDMQPLRTTDGTTTDGVISGASVTVGDTDTIEIGDGLTLTKPEAHVAHISGGGGGGTDWCFAAYAGTGASAFYGGLSPDPLKFDVDSFGTTNGATFGFDVTSAPDGDVEILTEGLYRLRLVVDPRVTSGFAHPGYDWDIAVTLYAEDAGANAYFGNEQFSGYPATAYTAYPPPVTAMTPPRLQIPENNLYLNLLDSYVTWPVKPHGYFKHGLADGDISTGFHYVLYVFRVADAISSIGSV